MQAAADKFQTKLSYQMYCRRVKCNYFDGNSELILTPRKTAHCITVGNNIINARGKWQLYYHLQFHCVGREFVKKKTDEKQSETKLRVRELIEKG